MKQMTSVKLNLPRSLLPPDLVRTAAERSWLAAIQMTLLRVLYEGLLDEPPSFFQERKDSFSKISTFFSRAVFFLTRTHKRSQAERLARIVLGNWYSLLRCALKQASEEASGKDVSLLLHTTWGVPLPSAATLAHVAEGLSLSEQPRLLRPLKALGAHLLCHTLGDMYVLDKGLFLSHEKGVWYLKSNEGEC